MPEKEAEVNWVSRPAAARLLGVGVPAVDSLIADGRLTIRRVPGSFARVLRTEVEALAEASTVKATTRC